MKEIYDLIKKQSPIPLMRVVKGMNQAEIYKLARYMYWTSSTHNQQIDLYFSDSRFRNRKDIFISLIYTLKPFVTKRYEFEYVDMLPVTEEYSRIYPYDSTSDNFSSMCSRLIDSIHAADPLAISLYRMLSSKHYKERFIKFLKIRLNETNPVGAKQAKLRNMHELFWHLSIPNQSVDILHAKAIATYNCVTPEELVINSFFDFMDKLI